MYTAQFTDDCTHIVNAVKEQKYEFAEYLLLNGANVLSVLPHINPDAPEKFHKIISFYARLVEHEDFNTVSYAIFASISLCDDEMLEYFISKGDQYCIINLQGHTALRFALKHNNKTAAKILFSAYTESVKLDETNEIIRIYKKAFKDQRCDIIEYMLENIAVPYKQNFIELIISSTAKHNLTNPAFKFLYEFGCKHNILSTEILFQNTKDTAHIKIYRWLLENRQPLPIFNPLPNNRVFVDFYKLKYYLKSNTNYVISYDWLSQKIDEGMIWLSGNDPRLVHETDRIVLKPSESLDLRDSKAIDTSLLDTLYRNGHFELIIPLLATAYGKHITTEQKSKAITLHPLQILDYGLFPKENRSLLAAICNGFKSLAEVLDETHSNIIFPKSAKKLKKTIAKHLKDIYSFENSVIKVFNWIGNNNNLTMYEKFERGDLSNDQILQIVSELFNININFHKNDQSVKICPSSWGTPKVTLEMLNIEGKIYTQQSFKLGEITKILHPKHYANETSPSTKKIVFKPDENSLILERLPLTIYQLIEQFNTLTEELVILLQNLASALNTKSDSILMILQSVYSLIHLQQTVLDEIQKSDLEIYESFKLAKTQNQVELWKVFKYYIRIALENGSIPSEHIDDVYDYIARICVAVDIHPINLKFDQKLFELAIYHLVGQQYLDEALSIIKNYMNQMPDENEITKNISERVAMEIPLPELNLDQIEEEIKILEQEYEANCETYKVKQEKLEELFSSNQNLLDLYAVYNQNNAYATELRNDIVNAQNTIVEIGNVIDSLNSQEKSARQDYDRLYYAATNEREAAIRAKDGLDEDSLFAHPQPGAAFEYADTYIYHKQRWHSYEDQGKSLEPFIEACIEMRKEYANDRSELQQQISNIKNELTELDYTQSTIENLINSYKTMQPPCFTADIEKEEKELAELARKIDSMYTELNAAFDNLDLKTQSHIKSINQQIEERNKLSKVYCDNVTEITTFFEPFVQNVVEFGLLLRQTLLARVYDTEQYVEHMRTLPKDIISCMLGIVLQDGYLTKNIISLPYKPKQNATKDFNNDFVFKSLAKNHTDSTTRLNINLNLVNGEYLAQRQKIRIATIKRKEPLVNRQIEHLRRNWSAEVCTEVTRLCSSKDFCPVDSLFVHGSIHGSDKGTIDYNRIVFEYINRNLPANYSKPFYGLFTPDMSKQQKGELAERLVHAYFKYTVKLDVNWVTKIHGNNGIDIIAVHRKPNSNEVHRIYVIEVKFAHDGRARLSVRNSIKVNDSTVPVKQMDKNWYQNTLDRMQAEINKNGPNAKQLQTTLDLLIQSKHRVKMIGTTLDFDGGIDFTRLTRNIRSANTDADNRIKAILAKIKDRANSSRDVKILHAGHHTSKARPIFALNRPHNVTLEHPLYSLKFSLQKRTSATIRIQNIQHQRLRDARPKPIRRAMNAVHKAIIAKTFKTFKSYKISASRINPYHVLCRARTNHVAYIQQRVNTVRASIRSFRANLRNRSAERQTTKNIIRSVNNRRRNPYQ